MSKAHESIIECRDNFVRAADQLAESGSHPVHITEGLAAALIALNRQVLGSAALVSWLRDAADHIEAGLLDALPPPVIR
jgi:hypothetical protein